MRRLRARRPLRTAGAAAVAASLALLATSCGVPIQSTASKLPGGVAVNQPSSDSTTTAPDYTTTIKIWFMVTYTHVAQVVRQVPKATLTAAIQALLTGPSQLQMDSGYQTALGTVALVRAVSVAAHVATVDFTSHFGAIYDFGALAVAQVVFTITTNATTVTEVQFQINGKNVGVPLPSGAAANGPVQPAKYETLKTSGPVSTTTTTTTSTTSTTAPAASGTTSGSASG